jgi:hypothetical protein
MAIPTVVTLIISEKEDKYELLIAYKEYTKKLENLNFEKILEFCELYSMLGAFVKIYVTNKKLLKEIPNFGRKTYKSKI